VQNKLVPTIFMHSKSAFNVENLFGGWYKQGGL